MRDKGDAASKEDKIMKAFQMKIGLKNFEIDRKIRGKLRLAMKKAFVEVMGSECDFCFSRMVDLTEDEKLMAESDFSKISVQLKRLTAFGHPVTSSLIRIPGVKEITRMFPKSQDVGLQHLFTLFINKSEANKILDNLKNHPDVEFAEFSVLRKSIE